MGHLRTDQLFSDHPDHLTVRGDGRVSDQPHQPDMPPAIDQPDATMSKGGSQLLRRLSERR